MLLQFFVFNLPAIVFCNLFYMFSYFCSFCFTLSGVWSLNILLFLFIPSMKSCILFKKKLACHCYQIWCTFISFDTRGLVYIVLNAIRFLAFLQYLKEQKLPPQTFIPLQSVRVKPIIERLRALGGSAKLVFDVIQYPSVILFLGHWSRNTSLLSSFIPFFLVSDLCLEIIFFTDVWVHNCVLS